MNKFGRFLDRISAKTCPKMYYFGSKSSKIAKRSPNSPLAFGGWQTPVQVK